MTDKKRATGAPTRAMGWGLLWTLIGFAIVLFEGIAVGRPQAGDTLSETVRGAIRFDTVGRFVFLPLWCWLTWHWVLRPQAMVTMNWRDAAAIAVGLAYAALEAWRFAGGLSWSR